ncbi:MAG: sulfotransferase [Candidatus Sulfotelmatobacter sp.]
MASESSTQPVFVTGIWRSGTSLLYALSNQNPQIKLMYEGDLLLLAAMFSRGRCKSDWKRRWDFWNAGLTRHELDADGIPGHPGSLASALESVGRNYAGPAIWGCKSPSYYDRLEQLSRMFPDARFVIIWRNPTDTFRSIVRAAENSSWFGKTGMLVRALLGNLELKKGCDRLRARGCRLHQLHYEELVRNPPAAMMAISEFLKIPYDSRMGSLEGADRSAIFSADHHALVKGQNIVSRPHRPEVLAPRLRRKIDRYVVYWKRIYGGTWPVYPLVPEGSAEASFLERVFDKLAFNIFRAWDRTVALVYCFAPLFLLAGYRRIKRSWQQDSMEEGRDALIRERASQTDSYSRGDGRLSRSRPFQDVPDVSKTGQESRT